MNSLLKLSLIFFLLSLSYTARVQKSLTLKSHKSSKEYNIDDSEVANGFALGDELMKTLDSYREAEVAMKQDIPRTDRMRQLAYDLVILLRNDIDKFNDHPSFLKRAKSVTPDCYYAEFVAKIFDTTTFPTSIVQAWIDKNEDSKRDLQWEYDEGAAYCIDYSTGYLCAATLLMLPDQTNPEKTALIQKLRER